MIKNMTCAQLKKACSENKYLLLYSRAGFYYGVNCKIAFIKKTRIKKHELKRETMFLGYRPANINEYISQKIPFMFNPIE